MALLFLTASAEQDPQLLTKVEVLVVAHFLDSSRPAAFSKWEQVMMQPPWDTSTMGR